MNRLLIAAAAAALMSCWTHGPIVPPPDLAADLAAQLPPAMLARLSPCTTDLQCAQLYDFPIGADRQLGKCSQGYCSFRRSYGYTCYDGELQRCPLDPSQPSACANGFQQCAHALDPPATPQFQYAWGPCVAARACEVDPAGYTVTIAAGDETAVVPAVVDGQQLIWGGDMIGGAVTVTRGDLIADTRRRWPGGVVPYDDSSFAGDADFAADLIAATTGPDGWSRAGIRFVRRTTEPDYVVFVRSPAIKPCGYSSVGMNGGAQTISIKPSRGCGASTLRHELGHALGLFHEHQRRDRDQYVTVQSWNFDPTQCDSFAANFDIVTLKALLSGPYDLASIMQYNSGACAKTGFPVITTKAGGPIFARLKLSDGDVCAVAEMYDRARFDALRCYDQTGEPPSADCRRTQGPFTWSCNGRVAGLTCLPITEPADPAQTPDHRRTWDDDFLCAEASVMRHIGYASTPAALVEPPTPGCTWDCRPFAEPTEDASHGWSDNLICSDRCHAGLSSCWNFAFSSNGPRPGERCLQISEPDDPDSWGDNYLCWSTTCGGA